MIFDNSIGVRVHFPMKGDCTMDLNQVVTGVTLTKACSIKADADSVDSKTVNLRIKFDGVTLQDVFAKAVQSVVIQWQNGPGRKQFSSWKANQTIDVEFKAPGRTTVDPEAAMVARLATMTAEERAQFIADLMAKAAK